MTAEPMRPLEGVRVLDLSRVLAGPTAAQTLADLGAEVIKIERPTVGDDTRLMGPHFEADVELVDRSAYFWAVNRGKELVAIDLAAAEGADLVRGLAARADVLIENFKVGTLDRYGLGVADLAAINTGLIYCSITGFGQSGRTYRNRAGYDSIIQAMGGLMSITGEPDGSPGGGPQRAGCAHDRHHDRPLRIDGDPGGVAPSRPHRPGTAHRPRPARRHGAPRCPISASAISRPAACRSAPARAIR